MKKIAAWVFTVCLLFCMTACGTQAENAVDGSIQSQTSMEESPTQAYKNEDKIPQFEPKDEEAISQAEINDEVASQPSDVSQEHILIAYFTWAENTFVENPEAVDVDASTSASVLIPGNTAKMAAWIQQRVGGDLFSIVVTEPYSSNYDECLDRAADEKAANARPELVNHVENMAQYDVVFLGFPNWWYTAPMAIFSFLEEYDFSGKTIVPFCAHGTGGLAGSIEDIQAELPDSAELLEAIGVYRPDVDSAQPIINEWLDELGFGIAVPDAPPEKQVRMILDGQEITISLNDTPTAAVLYEMLPLELTFEDYNGVEKISYLEETLVQEGESDGCDPTVGDFCLYAPWGNLSIFYQDFRYSDSLILLGHVASGMDLISDQHGDFTVTLERAR